MIKFILLNFILLVSLTNCLLSTNCGGFSQSQCLQCTNDACVSCVKGWGVQDAICIPVPTKQPDGSTTIAGIEHCTEQVISITSSTCTKCDEGYKLVKNNTYCQFEYQPIPQCMEYSNDKLQCNKCSDDYVLTKDKKNCVKKIPNCKEQDLNSCITCEEKYIKKNDGCIKKDNNNSHQIISLSLTAVCSSSTQSECTSCETLNGGDCNACKTGWNLQRYSCLPVVQYCKIMENATLCQQCLDGFQLNQQKTTCTGGQIVQIIVKNCKKAVVTLNSSTCDECHPGYKLNSQKTECSFVSIQNCDSYEASNLSKCASCISTFSPIEDQSICVTSVTNCAVHELNGCKKCNNLYKLENQKCVIDEKQKKENSTSSASLLLLTYALFVFLFSIV